LAYAVVAVIHADEGVKGHGAVVKSVAKIFVEATLPEDVLSAYVHYRLRATSAQRTTARAIVVEYFKTRCSPNEFITAVAGQLEGESKILPVPMNQLIREMCGGPAALYYFRLDEAALLSAEAFYLATERARLEYLVYHRDCCTPPLSDAEFALAQVLVENWTGPLTTLLETARQLSVAP
jgi:hypothetical protein